MRILWIILFLAATINVRAQSPEDALKRVLAIFSQPGDLYYEMRIDYFEMGKAVSQDSLEGFYHRKGQAEFMQLGPVEVFMSAGMHLSVDHEEHLLSVQQLDKGRLQQPFDPEQLDDLLKSDLLKVTGAFAPPPLKGLQIEEPDGQYRYRILYTPSNFTIREIEITGPDVDQSPGKENKTVRVLIQYSRFSDGKSHSFPYKTQQYISKRGKTYQPAGKCKGYRLI